MKHLILVTLIILAPIFLIGTVGAFEADNIGFGQCIIQGGLSVLTMWISMKALGKK